MRIFVSNLHFVKVDEQELRNLFAPYGELFDCRIIMTDGKSRGYGFVQFNDDKAGMRAMQELQGLVVHGRQLKIAVAHENKR